MLHYRMEKWIQTFLEQQRVGRLATVDEQNRPHAVPIVYAFDGERLYTPIDAKPKRVGLQDLQRVRNIRANPHVAVIIDHYCEDWQRLAWVMLRGPALLVESGPEQAAGARLLEAKYPQYAAMPLAGRAVIAVQVEQVTGWRAESMKV